MSDLIRSAIVPIYLLLCIILGGSTQGLYTNLALQLVGIGIIVWALLTRAPGPLPVPARTLFLLAGLLVLLFGIQLIPMPPRLWSALPGRGAIVEGHRLLGQPLPWLPLSLAPYDTGATLLTLIPPVAVISGMQLGDTFRPAWLAATVLLGTFAAVLLGVLQVGSSDPLTSHWYLYAYSNFGAATGFFANSNHMGALLLISIPLLIALVRYLRERAVDARAHSAALMLAVAGVLVLGVGVVLNGSLAVLLLGLPALTTSVAMLKTGKLALGGFALAALTYLVAVFALLLSPLGEQMLGENASSLEAREGIWATTFRATGDFMPFGSGIGTFRDLYPMYEDPSSVTTTVVNHAHNDYLEAVLESGIFGIVLLLLFFLWWVPKALIMWRPHHAADAFGQAAAIASGVLLLHSIVDYPLRMPALSALLAMCLCLMALPGRARSREAEELWPARHLRI